MSQPPHNGDASTVGPSNGAGTASASGHRGLREQAIAAFGILQRRADRVIAPERLRSFLQSRPISSFALFELLAEFARAQGLVVVHQDIAPDELLDRGLVDDLVLLPAGDIGLVMEVNTFARSITVQNLGPGAQERHTVDELARAYPGEIQVLHLQGQAPRFLADGTPAPPLSSDHTK